MVVLSLRNVLPLKTALVPFVKMADSGDIHISPAGVTLVTQSTNPIFPTVALTLRMRREIFQDFLCSENLWLKIDLRRLHDILAPVVNENQHILDVYADADDDVIDCLLTDTFSGDQNLFLVSSVSLQSGQMNVPDFVFEYQVAVEFRSTEFRNLITHLRQFGTTVTARVDNQVLLTVGNEEVVLSAEMSQFFTGAAVSVEHPVTFSFSIGYHDAFIDASHLSDFVWLYADSNSRVTLTCNAVPHTNLMFCFA